MRLTLPLAAMALILAVPAWSGKKDKKTPAAPAAQPVESPDAGPAVEIDPKAKAVVSYRHNLMEGMGKHMRLSAMIVKGEVERPDDMLMHAQALHHAAKATPSLFPKGTEPTAIESDSLPAVWEDWDGFLAANKTFEDATAKLVEVAKAGDLAGFKAQFGAVGKSCGGCHDTYRVDED